MSMRRSARICGSGSGGEGRAGLRWALAALEVAPGVLWVWYATVVHDVGVSLYGAGLSLPSHSL